VRNAHYVEEVRRAERALMAQVPDGSLMQRAAAGLASVCARLPGQLYGSRVVVLAGTGDNGGDALYAAALLARRGAVVTAVSTGPRAHAGGVTALLRSGGRLAERGATDLIDGADLIIDGMLGIGGRGGLREPAAALAARASAASALVVAADLPSGIDADTGEVAGAAVRADVTVTFGTWKPGLLIDPGATHAGAAELIDIGLAPYLPPASAAALQTADVAALLPRPTAETDKYRRGVLGILAGSSRFTGAANLAVGGAVRGGAGMVRLVTAEQAAAVVRQHWPEAVLTVVGDEVPAARAVQQAGQVQAWVVGPGFDTQPSSAMLLAEVLSSSLPVLVDADGITLLAANRGLLPRQAPTLITPHAGELARLLGTDRAAVEARRLKHAAQAAAELGVTVLLKGSTTVIATASGSPPVLVNSTGTGWLATAGSGDVLSGLAGALLAQGARPPEAAAVGAYLHGMAGRLAATGAAHGAAAAGTSPPLSRGAPIGAADLIDALPAAIRLAAAAAG